MTRMTVIVDDNLYTKFKSVTAARGLKVSDVIRECIEDFLDGDALTKQINKVLETTTDLPQIRQPAKRHPVKKKSRRRRRR